MDQFEDLARYYDPLMEHVDYDRWFHNVCTLQHHLLPTAFLHLDAGCGTGVLVDMLHATGWQSIGFDLSYAMLRTGKKVKDAGMPLVNADLCAIPFHNQFHLLTCLFDTVNFLLDEAQVRQMFRELYQALLPGGVLYFDIVTELMVTRHYENQTWTEDNGSFNTTWASAYDRSTSIANTHVRINQGANSIIRERIYPVEFLLDALKEAGFVLPHHCDAFSWRPPTKRTTRIDFVAFKQPFPDQQKGFKAVEKGIRAHLES